MDWPPFPIGYGILLNERYQFPMDMALVRARLDTKRQLFVDNHMIAHTQGVVRETHATKDHPDNPIFAPHVLYPEYICPDPQHGWRLYYNNSGILLHVAYSSDGIEWQRPELNVFDTSVAPKESVPAGPNNVVGFGQAHGLFFEPDDPDPQRRWKLILMPSKHTRVQRHQPWKYSGLADNRGGTIDGPKSTWQYGLGLATLRRDGFASLNADEDGGLVITRPFIFEGKGDLFVNADVSRDGELRVAVVDEDGAEELQHFGRDDSSAISRDTTRMQVQWAQRDSLAEFKDRYVRLTFHLRSARLYSFWIE